MKRKQNGTILIRTVSRLGILKPDMIWTSFIRKNQGSLDQIEKTDLKVA